MRKAVIAGNHLITPDSITFETKALHHAQYILHENDDLILYFDQIGVKIFEVVDTYKNLPLIETKSFARNEELPELPTRTQLIFENTLRNYSRSVLKSGRKSALHKSMFKENEEHIKCSCVGILISLVEILFKRYDIVVLVLEKQSNRIRVHDILKVKLAIPELTLIWV